MHRDLMNDRTLSITFSGPLADADGLPATAVVLPAIESFGDALRLMLRHCHDQANGHRPAYPALLAASALRLTAVDPASGSVALEIAGPMTLGQLADAPRNGLAALLSVAAADIHALPSEVAFPLRQIVERLPDGIAAVSIAGPPGMPSVKLTRELFAAGPAPQETFRCHGRLQEINWRNGSAVLNSPVSKCLLLFPGTMAEKMCAAANRLVSIAGTGERTPDGIIIIREITEIAINESGDGWTRRLGPLEDDVRQALAIMRWQEKQQEWFYDDELDAFVDAIQTRKYQ